MTKLLKQVSECPFCKPFKSTISVDLRAMMAMPDVRIELNEVEGSTRPIVEFSTDGKNKPCPHLLNANLITWWEMKTRTVDSRITGGPKVHWRHQFMVTEDPTGRESLADEIIGLLKEQQRRLTNITPFHLARVQCMGTQFRSYASRTWSWTIWGSVAYLEDVDLFAAQGLRRGINLGGYRMPQLSNPRCNRRYKSIFASRKVYEC